MTQAISPSVLADISREIDTIDGFLEGFSSQSTHALPRYLRPLVREAKACADRGELGNALRYLDAVRACWDEVDGACAEVATCTHTLSFSVYETHVLITRKDSAGQKSMWSLKVPFTPRMYTVSADRRLISHVVEA